MYTWIEGNKPEDMDRYYWIIVKGLTCNETYHTPCKYNSSKECWNDMENNNISIHSVVAYFPIMQPKSYTTIGTGCGYYIRAKYKGETKDTIYGFGLQPANWAGRGYNTLEKAKTATRRLKKIDEQDGYNRECYEVLDSESNVIWKLESK